MPKDQLGIGIVQFTILNSKGTPLAERLVFNQEGELLDNVAIASSSSNYAKGTVAELDITTNLESLKNKDFAADLSVSVTELAVTRPLEHQLDMRTYLLLNSELRGNIEQPGYYFYSNDPKRSQYLDILMMTQGWRQFITDAQPVANSFPNERGITIEGHVKERRKGEKIPSAYVSLTYWDDSGIGKNKVITDENGHFKFFSLDFIDKSSLLIKVLRAEGYKHNIQRLEVELDSLTHAPVTETFFDAEYFNDEGYENYMELPEERRRINTAFADEEGVIKLDEVVVNSWSKKMIDKRVRTNALHRNASNTIEFYSAGRGRSFPSIMDALQGTVAGVQIFEDGAQIRANNTFKGGGEPLYLLDGVEVYFDELNFLSPWEVDFVDILKSGQAAIYGSRGMNGVIAVFTIDATMTVAEKVEKNENSYKHSGFYPARKFYEPEIDPEFQDPKRYSTTLFWDPKVLLDKTGETKVSFPTGDRSGSYKVMLQGITQDGTPVSSETVFEID